MVVVSILPKAEFGPNDHREDAYHFNIWPPIYQFLSPLLSSSIFIEIHASHIKSNDKIDIANLIIGHVRYRNFDWRDGVCCDTWRRFGSTLLHRKLVSNRIEEYLNHVIHIILPISTEKNRTFSVLICSVFTTNLKLKLRISPRVRLLRCWSQVDVGNFILVTFFGC